VDLGVDKCKQPKLKMFVSAVLSGCYLSFGGAISLMIAGASPSLDMGTRRLIQGMFGLPIGLTMIVLCGTQLFTGNMAFFTFALWERRVTFLQALLSSAIIYLGNFIGSVLFALMIWGGQILPMGDGAAAETIRNIAEYRTYEDWGVMFMRGLLCNWFVCLALWQNMVAGPNDVIGKAVAIYPTILGFVALQMEHSISNMYMIPQGLLLGANTTVDRFFLYNIIPVSLGNIISGILFVGIAMSFIYSKRGK
jgi:formate/nitrite transporter